MLGHVRAIAMFPRLSGEESLISTLAHAVNRHEIPWLTIPLFNICLWWRWRHDFIVVCNGYSCVTLWAFVLQCLGCKAMTFKPQQRASVRYVYEGKDIFLWAAHWFWQATMLRSLLFAFDVWAHAMPFNSP